MMEAGIRGLQPQAKGCRQPLEAARGREGSEGNSPADTWNSHFRPPEP